MDVRERVLEQPQEDAFPAVMVEILRETSGSVQATAG
jgi:hypothetical protein